MTLTAYHNFDLLLTRAGARYKAIVVDAPEGEESAPFDPPFAPDALPRLDGLVRGVTRGAARHLGAADDPGPAAGLTDLGSQLFTAIFGGPVGNLWAASQASVAGEGAGLRLRLRFEEDAADLALLPWETLYDPARRQFVGLGEASPIVRYLALPRSRSALLVEPPLRVLAVLASPQDLPALDIEREWQAIQDALAGLVTDGKVVLERLARPTLDALQQRLLGEPVHILHFIGHGVFDEASQAGCLAFEDARGRPQLVRGDDLAKLLRNHPDLRLAYLNACEGALSGGGSVFTGMAQALVQGGAPAAVAMQAEISDAGAVELARTFYTALAAGRPVDAALTQARVALSAAGSPEWAIPVLFSRSPDNRLFDIRQVLPTPDCPYPGMAPFSEVQQDFFFGRDREIEDAVARLRQHPFLAVIGPSGSGKSSLIYAGVIPALRKSRRAGAGEWDIKTMRPSDQRTAAGQAAPRQALAELLGLTPGSPLPNPQSPTLLFVDQFEEVFTLAAADEAQAFLEALQGLIGRPNLSILLTVRADFYPELMACALWQPIRANRLELPPLGDDALWAAIVEPAGRVGVIVDEALAVRLIADASGQKGVLPLVQETLVLLWGRVKERQLRLKDYQALADGGRSGLQVAIDRRASLVYDNLPEAAQPLARRIFLRLVQFGEGRADTRRQQSEAELRASGDDPALFDATLATLIASRLLTATGEAGSPDRRVDIAHEALIAGWPRLQGWLAQRRAAEQTRRRLEAKAAEWMGAEKRGGLLDEYELQEAEHWLAGEDAGELGYSQELADLVKVSREALAQAAAEQEEQQRRELVQAQKLAVQESKSANRLRLLVAIVAALALIAPGMWVRKQILKLLAASPLVEVSAVQLSVEPSVMPIQVPGFHIEQYEVSNRQYGLCVQAGACEVPVDPKPFQDPDLWNHPVVYITAYQADNYCRWLGRRLPTSLEWIRVAQGSDGKSWPWGPEPPDPSRVNMSFVDHESTGTSPVDSYPEGRSIDPEGIFHLIGNVWEWTATPMNEDPYSSQSEWKRPIIERSDVGLMIFGGSFMDDGTQDGWTTMSNPSSTSRAERWLGFRCAQ